MQRFQSFPKETWLAKRRMLAVLGIFRRHLDSADQAWDRRTVCWGCPTRIHLDNAKDFHGKMLRRACEQYGIALAYPPRTDCSSGDEFVCSHDHRVGESALISLISNSLRFSEHRSITRRSRRFSAHPLTTRRSRRFSAHPLTTRQSRRF
jgi:hypothetical protein